MSQYGLFNVPQDPANFTLVSDAAPLPVNLSQVVGGAAAAALGDSDPNPITLRLGLCLTVWDGSQWLRYRVPSTRKKQAGVAIGAIATVWTPAAGKKFRLLGGSISVDSQASVLFEDNSGGNFVWQVPVLPANLPHNFDLGPEGYLASAVNNVLKATSSVAANLTGTLYGCEE